MSTGTDFLANLQKKTVKNTVQQKQQKRVNASAAVSYTHLTLPTKLEV